MEQRSDMSASSWLGAKGFFMGSAVWPSSTWPADSRGNALLLVLLVLVLKPVAAADNADDDDDEEEEEEDEDETDTGVRGVVATLLKTSWWAGGVEGMPA